MENGQIMIGEKARLLAVIAWLLLLFAIGVSEGAAMGQGQSHGYAQNPTAQIKETVDRMISVLSEPSLKGDGKKNLRHQLAREAILPSLQSLSVHSP